MESPSANEDARAAVSNNDEEKLRNALGRGADANFTWTQGRHSPQYSLLTSAARNGFDGCCRLLLARGADPNLSTGHLVRLPMHEACVGAVRRGKVAERCACVRQAKRLLFGFVESFPVVLAWWRQPRAHLSGHIQNETGFNT